MADGILIPIDFSDVTEVVLAQAGQLAKALGAKTWLIHVAEAKLSYFADSDVGPVMIRESVAQQFREEHLKLQQYEQSFRAEGLEVTSMLVKGTPAEKIVDEARRLKPDLIVLGSHGHGALHHLLMGSVSEGVLKKAKCPVVIVPSRDSSGGH